MLAGFVRLGHDRADMASESFTYHWRPYAEHGGARAFVRQIRSLRMSDAPAVADALPSLRVPARVVWGAADRLS
jgi:hypothetical protein